MNKNLNTAFIKGGLRNIEIGDSDVCINIDDINKYLENDAIIGETDIKVIIENMVINTGSMINLNKNDIDSVFSVEGDVFVGLAYETGEDAPSKAVESIKNVIPKDSTISENVTMLLNFLGDSNGMRMNNLNAIMQDISTTLGGEVDIYFSITINDALNDEVYVFCAVSGLNA